MTLIQRLLNSSKQIIVYGKNSHFMDTIIGQLQQFTGITNIDQTVMHRKFNTFQIEDKNRKDTHAKGYAKPQDLTNAQKKSSPT